LLLLIGILVLRNKEVDMVQNNKNILGEIWGFCRIIIGLAPLGLILIYGFWKMLIFYVVIGIILFIFLRYKKLLESPQWLVDLSVTLVIWPISLLFWKKLINPPKKTILNEINDIVDSNPVMKMQKEYFFNMNKDGTTEDIIPNGQGRFGFDVTNPIHTNNIFGSNAYLGRLRDNNGNQINYNRLGSTSASNINNPIDIYELSDSNGNMLGTIYISPYQKNISKKAPEGFILK